MSNFISKSESDNVRQHVAQLAELLLGLHAGNDNELKALLGADAMQKNIREACRCAGEVDEEEEARKRAEKEAEERRIAEEKAREEAEEAELNSANAALEEQLRAAKARKAAEEAEEARKARNRRIAKVSLVAAVILAIASGLTYYFINKKAPDFYILTDEYESHALTMSLVVEESDVKPTIEFAYAEVKQEADKVQKTGGHGSNKPKDVYGIGSAANVFGTGTIVK